MKGDEEEDDCHENDIEFVDDKTLEYYNILDDNIKQSSNKGAAFLEASDDSDINVDEI